MLHGTLHIGDLTIIGLCDGVVLSSGPAEDSFPGCSDAVWAEARERYPAVAGEGGRWRLHVHCFVLRSAGRTMLVDTGIGPESAPAFAWTGTRGALLEGLAEAELSPADVDDVVITHVHDDHLGWNVAAGTTTPLFPNARYVVHRADWALMANATDEEDRAIFSAVLEPLEHAGVLTLSDDTLSLAEGLTVVHAPGHTPGHQVVVYASGRAHALISGDLVNHPVQLLQPGVAGTSDSDPELAAATRAEWLERFDRTPHAVCPAHFPEVFGSFISETGRREWTPAYRPTAARG